MMAFVYVGKPLSYNADGKAAYQERLRTAYRDSFGDQRLNDDALYGTVYYLKKSPHTLDADNLSKPVWDALSGLAYHDDSEIGLRHAGIVDMQDAAIDVFDLSRIPDEVANRLIEVLGSKPHVLYIELGPLRIDMYRFGLS